MLISFIWNVSPELFSYGPLTASWYGLLFGISFLLGYSIFAHFYKKEGVDVKEADTIFLYTVGGGILGARIGHILFYNFSYYLENPMEIFFIWHGGLASHGGAIGILLLMFIYVKKKKYRSYLWIIDRMVIPIAMGGMFIRFGNFFNSEIIGKPTDLPWGVMFERIDSIYRHPSQLYEAFSYLGIFIFLWVYYAKKFPKIKEGSILGLFLVLIFSVRFILEFTKENQVDFESNMLLNMGQILSVPLVLLGFWLIFRKVNKAEDNLSLKN